MEQKLVRVPFSVDMAKKITDKSVEGKVVTRNGRNARIICFDAHCDDSIVALIEDEKGVEYPKCYVSDGYTFLNGESDSDLMLEVPEYMTFKDGDILSYESGTFILKQFDGKDRVEYYVNLYGPYTAFDSACLMKNLVTHLRFATEEEKQKLINALKASKEPEAKECLNILGIKVKQESEFAFGQIVLVRCDGGIWSAAEFSHINGDYFYVFGGIAYKNCIPYNDQTKHLLGTTDNWEE